MKRLLAMLLGSLAVVLLVFSPGDSAYATEPSEGGHCGCVVSPVNGAERNKIVADLLKNEQYKSFKAELEQAGYIFKGAENVEVIIIHTVYGNLLSAGAFFKNEEGTELVIGSPYVGGNFVKVTIVDPISGQPSELN